MSKKIKPLGDKVLVKRKSLNTTKNGIILPETAQEKPLQGEVIAIGPGRIDDKGNLKKMTLKVKDKVLFSSFAGTEYKEEDEEYLIVSEEEVLAVIE
jgi:chaperonin GroES